jgi:hypothetical protein
MVLYLCTHMEKQWLFDPDYQLWVLFHASKFFRRSPKRVFTRMDRPRHIRCIPRLLRWTDNQEILIQSTLHKYNFIAIPLYKRVIWLLFYLMITSIAYKRLDPTISLSSGHWTGMLIFYTQKFRVNNNLPNKQAWARWQSSSGSHISQRATTTVAADLGSCIFGKHTSAMACSYDISIRSVALLSFLSLVTTMLLQSEPCGSPFLLGIHIFWTCQPALPVSIGGLKPCTSTWCMWRDSYSPRR